MLKSSAPRDTKRSLNAAEHLESNFYQSPPELELSTTIQKKEDSSIMQDSEMNKSSFLNTGKSQGVLPEQLKNKMEYSLGSDFSNVQIETNSASAQSMGAKAYAQGNKIAFAPGAYEPKSKAGQKLIGHELTHVVQQRSNNVPVTQQFSGVNINTDSQLENEADQKGEMAAEGKKTELKSTSATTQNNVTQGFGWNSGKELLHKTKKRGMSKASEGLAWGKEKGDHFKSKANHTFHSGKEMMEDKINEGKGRLDKITDGRLMDSFDSITKVRDVSFAFIQKFTDHLQAFGMNFLSKSIPLLETLKSFILKVVDPVKIIRKITQTLNAIFEILKQKAHELKSRLEDATDVERAAKFVKSLAEVLQRKTNDVFKFVSYLEQAVNGTVFDVLRSAYSNTREDISLQTKFVEEKLNG